MPARAIVATFGFNEGRVLRALRLLPYDRLVLLAGRDSLRTPGFRRLRALEPTLRTAVADPFDFLDCLRTACGVLHDLRREGAEVRVSVSGGTKILADAAVVAAFQEGVAAWYCDPEPVRLPVLRGVRIADALGPAERLLASLLTGPRPVEDLVRAASARGVSRTLARVALRNLRDHGLAVPRLVAGTAVVEPSPALETYRAHFRATETGKG